MSFSRLSQDCVSFASFSATYELAFAVLRHHGCLRRRLYAWDKILTPGYIPATFTNQFALADPGLAALGYTSGGFKYYGTITIVTNLAVSSTYKKDLLQITISLSWTNGSMPHQASMTTFVARYGLYTYVY